jgi:drug/metabolite transporter (DMT)-like permease
LENTDKIKYKAEFLLLFVSLNWGISFPVIKIMLDYISPQALVFYRFTLTLFVFIIMYPKIFGEISWRDLKYGLILGIFIYIGFITQTIGLAETTAQKSAFITGIYVVILPFAQYFIIKKIPKAANIAGVVLVTIGLFFLTQVRDVDVNIGDILTLICALFFAIHIVYLDVFLNEKKADYKALVLGQFIVMAVFGFISMVGYEVILTNEYNFVLNTTSVLSLLYTALACTLLAWIIINKYQKYTTPVKAGIIYSMEVVFAAFSAYLIINEVLEFEQIIGALIMLAGMAVSEFYDIIRKRKSNEKDLTDIG